MAFNYAYYLYVTELPELLAATNALEARLRLAGNSLGADQVIRAYSQLRAELEALGVTMAVRGTEILREKERSSRVRPDTQGAGGPRLGDNLDCDPLPIVWGSVGIANEDLLDRNVPWWSTNEEGSSARVGKVLYGVFEPGEAAPEGGLQQNREHPLFQPLPSKGSPSGLIRNPIPARRFIEHSIPEIDVLWRDAFDAIKATFVTQITLAQVP